MDFIFGQGFESPRLHHYGICSNYSGFDIYNQSEMIVFFIFLNDINNVRKTDDWELFKKKNKDKL